MVISYHTLPRRVLRAHNKTTANYKWIRDNWEDIRKKHTNEFIAVVDHQVVYHTKTYANLLKYISEHRDRPDLIATRVRSHDNILLR